MTIAWLFWAPEKRWMRTHEFSFGWTAWGHGFPSGLRAGLQAWAEQFATDTFTEDVSSKCVTAWKVSYENAVDNDDVLVERLRALVDEVGSL